MHIPKKYFDVLQIAPTTNKSVIKKAYRKLVFLYHPDVNPSNESHQKFIEITEAYEICMGERSLNQRRTINSKTKKTPQQEREERLKRAKEFYKQAKIKEELENKLFFEKLISGKQWKFLKLLSVVCVLFVTLLITDYFLPVHEEKEIISSTVYFEVYIILKIKDKTYYIGKNDLGKNSFSKYVILEKSKLLNQVKNIKIINVYGDIITVKPQWTLFDLIWLITIVFLIPVMVVFYKKPTVIFTFFYYISLYLIPIFIVILFLFVF